MYVDLKPCTGETTLDKLYDMHDGKFLCVLITEDHVVGELKWEQGHAPNYYIDDGKYKYYHFDIKSIGVLSNET